MAVESWSCQKCTFRHEYAAHRCTMCNALREAVESSSSSNQPTQMRREFIETGLNSRSPPTTVTTRNFELIDRVASTNAVELNSSPNNRIIDIDRSKVMGQRNNYKNINASGTNHLENDFAKESMNNYNRTYLKQQQELQSQGAGRGHMPPVFINNPYSTKTNQSTACIVGNPYKKGIQQQEQPLSSMEAVGVNVITNCSNVRQQDPSTQQAHKQQYPHNQQQQHNSFPMQGNPPSIGNCRLGSSNAISSSNAQGQQQTNVRPSSSYSIPGYRQGSLPFITKEVFEAGPVPICVSTQHNWIYPLDENYPERAYQLEMSHTSIMQNTLVSLPTGLGKTLIAAVVMYNYYRWYPTGKVVFCAPTRPLVSQQIHACYKIMGIPEKQTAEISGRSKPDSREAMWRNKRVFFCTPQTLVKDIEEGRCEAKHIVCIVIDEAHRATGDHAYSVLVRLIEQSSAKYRLLGLSATPGTDIKSIQAVLNTLKISRIEARTEDDPVVKQYIHHREEEIIVIKQPDIVKSLDRQFSELIAPILCRLREENVSQRLQCDSANLSSYAVYQACQDYIARTHDHRLSAQFFSLRELVAARYNLKQHGVNMARNNLVDASRKHYMNFVTRQAAFQSLLHDLDVASGIRNDEGMDNRTSTNYKNNPKLLKLVEVLVEHFERKKAVGESTRAIVFSQWRDSVIEIVRMLESQKNVLLKAAQFIGQSTKKGKKTKSSSGQDALAGMNQAQQQKVLKQFSEGVYNILVCTCVGEEGLDIGEVDLIVNFDVMKSPIRSIQRNGRTGRKRNGRVVFLVAEQEEKSYQQSVMNSNKIARALKDPSVFKLSRNIPMFEVEPTLMRKKMIVAAFHLSQVSGHTPKARGRNLGEKIRRVRSAAVEIQWRLEPNEEVERFTKFGQLPPSSCLAFEKLKNEFPPSLRRKFINMRNQSFYSKYGAANVGRSSRIVRILEKMHALPDNKEGVKFSADVPESIRGKTINQVEILDSEDDCRALSFDCELPLFDCLNSANLDAERNHSANKLDGIFGPNISVSPDECDFSQVAYLFEAHNNIAVVAPPGMALDESEEETTSSVLSEMSTTDDLCAFFDNTSTVDLEVRTSPKSFFSEVNHLNSIRGGQVDSYSDHYSDIGGSYGIDTHSVEDEVVVIGKEEDTNSHLESTKNTGGENQEGNELSIPCRPPTEINGSTFPSEVENASRYILSLNSVREENRLSSFERERYGPRILSQENMHEIGNAIASCTDHYVYAPPVENQFASDITTSFHLSTPPPSSDESDDSSHNSREPKDEVLCTEDIVNKGSTSIKPDFFFQLPTQNSSSSDEEDEEEGACNDDDQSEKSSQHQLLACSPPLLEVTNTITRRNIQEDTARQTSSDTSMLSSSHLQAMSMPENLTDTPIRAKDEKSYPTMHLEDLTDTPLQNRQHTEHQRKSLDSLTDTPLERHQTVGKLRKRLLVAPERDRMVQAERSRVESQASLESHENYDHQRKSLDTLTDTPEEHKNISKLRKRRRVGPGRDHTNQPEEKSRSKFQDMDKVRKKIEQKYRCKFLDTEAYDESENSDDEEDIIKQIEDEEMSHDSFINDSSQLGYTQDDLDRVNEDSQTDDCDLGESNHHRQINHQQDMNDFWKTPVFNRRMVKATTSESQDSEPSQKGLGNMYFIRSVLDHHRAGGDADQIEEEYHQLAGSHNSQEADSPIQSNYHSSLQAMRSIPANNFDSSIQVGVELKNRIFAPPAKVVAPTFTSTQNNQTVVLTAEQRAMIEAKRLEALRRRQLKMQTMQQVISSAPPINPYAK